MNSKRHLFEEAERLYIYRNKSIDTIAHELNLNRKTIMAWKEEGDWSNRRKAYFKSKQTFHEELYEFARSLMKGIAEDMKAGEKIDPGRMYAFCRIIPMFAKVKDYEDIVAKKGEKNIAKGLTPELIAKIEQDILGIPPQTESENDENGQ